MAVTERTAQAEILLLGPLALVVGGRTVEVAGRRRRALLARLALQPGSPIAPERLADDLWEDDWDHRSTATLRTYITKLRSVLPSGGSLIVSQPTGYALNVGATAIDAFRFEDLVHLETDDATAERVLDDALTMWRGSALEEFAHLDWARATSVRLDELRLYAYERLFDARLSRGRHAAIVDTLRALVHAHPLRERFAIQLVTALYRCGRQADALDVQRQARAILAAELGLDPTRELDALERQILDHDPTLAAPPGHAAPKSEARGGVMPGALQRHDASRFVARIPELEVIADRLAHLDGAQLLIVTGEPGIGKTWLALQAATIAAAQGATVLYGSHDEHLDVPFQAYVEALGDFARRAPLDGLAALLGDDAGALVQLIPGLAPHLPVGPAIWASSDPSAEQHRLFDAVVSWLSALSNTNPVVLVLDDLQWASRAATLLTAYAVRHLRDRPVLVVATVRAAAPDDGVMVDALARLQREQLLDTIALSEFGMDAARALAQREGVSLPAEALTRMYRASGGNPFFFAEMLRTEEVPRSIRDVLLSRVSRLSAPTRDLLFAGSVAGLEFDLDVVSRAANLDEDTALAALDEAATAGLTAGVDGAANRVAFRHGIVQETLYGSLNQPRRRVLHRRIAQAGEDACAQRPPTLLEAADIARHWRHAGPDHGGRASTWSIAAGAMAMKQLAYEEAVRHYEYAVEHASGDELGSLYRDLASALARSGDAARGRESTLLAIEHARAAGDRIALARAALGTTAGGRGVSAWIADTVRVTALTEAYEGIDEPELRVRVGGELALARYLPEERAHRQALAREAVELAVADGSDPVVAAALAASRVRFWKPADTANRLAFARRVEAIAVTTGDIWLEVSALDYIRGDAHELGDRVGFDRAGMRVCEIARRTGGVFLSWRAKVVEAHRALLDARLDVAEQYATEALAVWGDDPAPDALLTFGYHVGLIRLEQRRHREVVDVLETALAMWPGAIGLRAALASQYAAIGDLDRAAVEFELCIADDMAAVPQDSGWLAACAFLADAAVRLRHRQGLAALRELLTPIADRFVTMAGPDISMGSMASYLSPIAAASGDERGAAAWLRRARELESAFGDQRNLVRPAG